MSLVITGRPARPALCHWQGPEARDPRAPRAQRGRDHYCACRSQHFHSCGGVVTGGEIAERLRHVFSQPFSLLARWIVDRQVLTFSCCSGLMFPVFQFDFVRGCVHSGVVRAMSELSGALIDDEVARWFVRPNGWLSGATPADSFVCQAPAVLAAARADRFLAKW